MDEPTSVLTEQETDDLFASLKQFSKDGILIIYITHKLKEVLSLCDEVAVMRKGKVVSVGNTIDEKIETLANKMVGENLNTIKKKINNFKDSEEILNVSNLNFKSDDPYETNLKDLNKIGYKPFVVGFVSMLTVGFVSLAAIDYLNNIVLN